MRHALLIVTTALCACTIQGGKDVPPAVGSEPVIVDPKTQTVSVDQSKVPVLDTCADGQFVRWNGGKWDCATPAEVAYQAGAGLSLANSTFSLSTACSATQVLRYDGHTWSCSNAGTTDYLAGSGLTLLGATLSLSNACAATQVLRFDGTAWSCSNAGTSDVQAGSGLTLLDTTLSLSNTCAPTQVLRFDGTNWSCSNAGTFDVQAGSGLALTGTTLSLPTTCATSQVLRFDGTGWSCSNAGTFDVQAGSGLALTGTTMSLPSTCASGQVLRWSGSAWTCTNAGTTDYQAGDGLTLSGSTFSLTSTGCQAGYGPRWTGSAWACSAITDGIFQPIQVPRPNIASKVDSLATGGSQTGIGVSITVGANGLPVIAYFQSSSNKVLAAACQDLGCGSFTISLVEQTTGAVTNTSIAIGTDLLPVIAYGDAGAGAVKVAHCQDPKCSTSTISSVAATSNSGLLSMTIGTDGLPIISYRNYPSAGGWELMVAHCNDLACGTAASVVEYSAGFHDGDMSSIAIGSDGKPVIAFYQEADQTLHVAKCGDDLCTPTLSTVSTVAAVMGLYPSLTIGADGLPVISCFNWYGGLLELTKCGNAACSAGNTSTTVTVSTPSGTGYTASSITVGPDGLPVVAFCDLTNHNVNVLKCGNAACSAGNVTRTIDTSTEGTEWAAVTIGVDGIPIIAATATNPTQELDVFHCTNPFCVPNWTRR